MKANFLAILFFLLNWSAMASDDVPVAISPGSARGVAAVESRCPTFSWSGVGWAQKYRVVVFAAKSMSAKESAEAEPAAQPVLSEHIAGGALSWTPSVSQGLNEGVDYAWCVGALDAGGAWTWSEVRRFPAGRGQDPTVYWCQAWCVAGELTSTSSMAHQARASSPKARSRRPEGHTAVARTASPTRITPPTRMRALTPPWPRIAL